MPIGVICNCSVVVIGGIAGAVLKNVLSRELKEGLMLIFSVCALAMGVVSVNQMQNMPAVIFSVILGTTIGILLHLGDLFQKGGKLMQKPIARIFKAKGSDLSEQEYLSMLVTIIVLFCASGTGIYGCIDSGMTQDHTILISKSILDLFTAMIFACNLGPVVSVIAIPQFVVFILLFSMAKIIFPLTTPAMISDFKACGGILLLATGFRMMKVKEFPVADMIPAMILVMPVSYLWMEYIMKFL